MKKLATNLDNNKVIEVVEVNGGWTTCRDIDEGFEFKLRNGKIGEYVAPVLAEEPDICPKCKTLIVDGKCNCTDAKKTQGYMEPAGECPVCGSNEVYHGVIDADGHTIINEESDWGCHHCDFEMRAADYNENGDKLVKADLDHYVKGAGTTNSGRPTVDIDDVVAKALRGDDLGVIYPKVAAWLKALGRETIGRGSKKMEVSEENLRNRYGKLNVGMQRMNLGNVLRGAMNDLGVNDLPEIE